MPTQLPKLVIANAVQWGHWLAEHGSESAGVFITVVKEGRQTPATSLTYQEALDEALCYGWIDSGGGGKLNDVSYSFRFTPRRAKSSFSPRNVGFVERLEREGRIQPPGRNAINAAKEGGRWGAANLAKRAGNSAASQSSQGRDTTKRKRENSQTASKSGTAHHQREHQSRQTRSGRPAPSYKE